MNALALGSNHQTLLKLLLLAIAGTLLSGCGATIKNRTTGETGNWDGSSVGSKSGAECNFFDSRSIRLSGKVTTYYLNGMMQEDRIRLRITGIDARFENNSNVHLKMFRWKAHENGTTQIDTNPVSFVVESGANGHSPVSSSMSSLNLIDITKIRQSGGISGTTTQSFFDNTVIAVSGVDYQWQVLKVVLYEGGAVLGEANVLLPIFSANPNSYAVTHPPVLNQLHPFWSQRSSSGMTDKDWIDRSRSYCF